MYSVGTTLARFLIEQQSQHHEATGEFTMLLLQIATAGKIIASEVRRAALANILGLTGEVNVQGEQVRKLDEFANSVFLSVMEYSRLVCEIVSEEIEGATRLSRHCKGRKYSVQVDPLDGSSNIDINGTVGSIFAIHRRRDETLEETPDKDLLRKGTEQVAAGYVMYGPSTVLVLTCGDGVNAFTLDPGIGEFVLSHPNLRLPAHGKTYAINIGNRRDWHPWTARLVDHLSESGDYSERYVGSLVADFHRILIEGGLYLYPGDRKRADGKLRLLYECAPLAFIAEQAGGRATTGAERILDIQPTHIHQRTPLVIGSTNDVAVAVDFVRRGSAD